MNKHLPCIRWRLVSKTLGPNIDDPLLCTEKWTATGNGRPLYLYKVYTTQGELLLETRSILEVTAFVAGFLARQRLLEK